MLEYPHHRYSSLASQARQKRALVWVESFAVRSGRDIETSSYASQDRERKCNSCRSQTRLKFAAIDRSLLAAKTHDGGILVRNRRQSDKVGACRALGNVFAGPRQIEYSRRYGHLPLYLANDVIGQRRLLP